MGSAASGGARERSMSSSPWPWVGSCCVVCVVSVAQQLRRQYPRYRLVIIRFCCVVAFNPPLGPLCVLEIRTGNQVEIRVDY
jgi:hypothetical protein